MITFISEFLLAFLTIIVFYEVVARYFFKTPIVQTQELVYLIFPWAVFLTAINITANHDHLSIDFFRNFLPTKLQKIIIYFCDVAKLIFVIYMFIAGVNITRATIMAKTSILLISKSWFYLAMPVAFAGMIAVVTIEFIQKIKTDIKKK